MQELTPYQRGYQVGLTGGKSPPFSKPDSSWADRLYERGWSAGVDARLKAAPTAQESK